MGIGGNARCLAISVIGGVAVRRRRRKVAAPLVDLQFLRNPVLVGTTVAILLVAGAINALMYLLSWYFQNRSGFAMTALQAALRMVPRTRGR